MLLRWTCHTFQSSNTTKNYGIRSDPVIIYLENLIIEPANMPDETRVPFCVLEGGFYAARTSNLVEAVDPTETTGG